jgi:mevalonate kinase
MIIECPAKAIVLGEWAVLGGARALGLAVPDTHFKTTITVDATVPSQSVLLTSIDGASFELDLTKPFMSVPEFWTPAVRFLRALAQGALGPERVQHLAGSSIHFERSWPVNHGLGSSGALFLSLAALSLGPSSSVAELQKRFDHIRRIVSELFSGSGFDVALSLWGGLLENERFVPTPSQVRLPKNLHLVHTLSKLSTQVALKSVTGSKLRTLQQKISDSLRTFWESRDWSLAFNEHLAALNTAGLVPAPIEKRLALWRHRGWIEAGKTMGAGGGDGLWVLIHPNFQDEFLAEMRALDYFVRPIGQLPASPGLTLR